MQYTYHVSTYKKTKLILNPYHSDHQVDDYDPDHHVDDDYDPDHQVDRLHKVAQIWHLLSD